MKFLLFIKYSLCYHALTKKKCFKDVNYINKNKLTSISGSFTTVIKEVILNCERRERRSAPSYGILTAPVTENVLVSLYEKHTPLLQIPY